MKGISLPDGDQGIRASRQRGSNQGAGVARIGDVDRDQDGPGRGQYGWFGNAGEREHRAGLPTASVFGEHRLRQPHHRCILQALQGGKQGGFAFVAAVAFSRAGLHHHPGAQRAFDQAGALQQIQTAGAPSGSGGGLGETMSEGVHGESLETNRENF